MCGAPSGVRTMYAPPTLRSTYRIAEKISPGEFRRGQRLPHLLGRGDDVDGVDDGGLELADIHPHHSTPSIFRAASGTSSACPDSSRLLRLDIMAGHPLEMPCSILLSCSISSCVSVSLTYLP